MQDGSRNFSQTKKQGTIPAQCQKSNDPCPRFSSVDKGHFWSLLVSNIIFGYLHFFFYLLLFDPWTREILFTFFFSSLTRVPLVSWRFWWVFRKRRVVQWLWCSGQHIGFHRLDLTLSLRLASVFRSLCVPLAFPSKSVALLCHWTVPPLLWL